MTRWQNWNRESIGARGKKECMDSGQGSVGSWFGGTVVVTARVSGCLIKEASQLGMPSRQLIVPF